MKRLEPPEAIMINVPQAYFTDSRKFTEEQFRNYYEAMGTERLPTGLFYHYISCVPVHQVTHVFICFGGFVRYKAPIVEFIKNSDLSEHGMNHEYKRDWMVTTGPVVKAPAGMIQRGFRGFRYTKMLY